MRGELKKRIVMSKFTIKFRLEEHVVASIEMSSGASIKSNGMAIYNAANFVLSTSNSQSIQIFAFMKDTKLAKVSLLLTTRHR